MIVGERATAINPAIDPSINQAVNQVIEEIKRLAGTRPFKIMEVCGTHTMSIARHGIKQVLPPNIRLISGPGCPVCVTAQSSIDQMIELARKEGVILATFGDMLRVPGAKGNLAEARAKGAQVEVVYSPVQALKLAEKHRLSGKDVVFLGIGFETTAPLTAATVLLAQKHKIGNFYVYAEHKVIPPALHALCSSDSVSIDALLLPGHVSAILGTTPYSFLAADYGLRAVISGFEPDHILTSVLMLLRQVESGQVKVDLQYESIVRKEGNPEALAIMYQVFETSPALWRGLGSIPESGLALRQEFDRFDAKKRFGLAARELESNDPKGCACGLIIQGAREPSQCALFGKKCTPEKPVGPCMVSSEGACAAYYLYGNN